MDSEYTKSWQGITCLTTAMSERLTAKLSIGRQVEEQQDLDQAKKAHDVEHAFGYASRLQPEKPQSQSRLLCSLFEMFLDFCAH